MQSPLSKGAPPNLAALLHEAQVSLHLKSSAGMPRAFFQTQVWKLLCLCNAKVVCEPQPTSLLCGETLEKGLGVLPTLWSRSFLSVPESLSPDDVTCALDPFVKEDKKTPDHSLNTAPLLCPLWWQCSKWEASGDPRTSYLPEQSHTRSR